jgi:hypothetical protein
MALFDGSLNLILEIAYIFHTSFEKHVQFY